MIVLPDDDPRDADTWTALLELPEIFPAPWTLIGAQMVELHALERDSSPPSKSVDIDVLASVRLVPGSTQALSKSLIAAGYRFAGANAAGIGHRFVRGSVKVDILAPDGLGARTSTRTIGGARTVEVPGGSQALARSELVAVRHEDKEGKVPRPNLLGAILIKSRAVQVDDVPEGQRRDLAFLLSLVEDPIELRGQMRSSERSWLKRRSELSDPSHPAWIGIRNAGDGRAALDILARNPR